MIHGSGSTENATMKLKYMLALWSVVLLLAGCATMATRSRTEDIIAGTDAKQLALACFVWAGEHNGALPPDLDALRELATTQNREAFELCARGKLADIKNPAATILLREKQATPGGHRAVAYADGHSELIPVPTP
jgi:hypothetical protein